MDRGRFAGGEEGRAAQDEILVWNLIWAIDYRDWDYALRLAAHAIRFNLASPERYNRTVACFVAEDIAKLSLDQQEAVPHEVLCRVLALIEGHDMPDPAKAKLHKALARSSRAAPTPSIPPPTTRPPVARRAYLAEALDHARRAHQLDSSIGVKSDIRSLEKGLQIRPGMRRAAARAEAWTRTIPTPITVRPTAAGGWRGRRTW
jgi:hypothetical protein